MVGFLTSTQSRGWRRARFIQLSRWSLVLFLTLFCSFVHAGQRNLKVQDALKAQATESALVESSLLLDVTHAGQRLVAVGERGHIIYSDDNGKSWVQARVPVQEMLTAVDFPTPEKGWAVGHSGVILTSGDGGKSWVKQIEGNEANRLMVAALETAVSDEVNKRDAAVKDDREELQKELEDLELLLDDARSFVEEGPTRPFLDVFFFDELDGFAVGAFGLILKTEDGGKNWHSIADRVGNFEGLHLNAIGFAAGGLFIAGERGLILRSLDRGDSWQLLDAPYEGTFFGMTGDSERVVVLGLRGNAFVSFDKGESWTKIQTGTSSTLSAGCPLEDGRLIVAQYGKNLLEAKGDWTVFTPLPGSGSLPRSSVVASGDGALVTVGLGGVRRLEETGSVAEDKVNDK